MYVSFIDPHTAANASRLGSDTDRDTLALLQEAGAKTNPVLNDTDGDGLPNAWEVKYCSVSGVAPTDAADDSVLASNTDGDGLTLLEEAKANKDPKTADNDPTPMNTTKTTTMATTATDLMSTSVSSSEISVEGSFAFFIVLPLFTFSSLALVIYRMRRQMP